MCPSISLWRNIRLQHCVHMKEETAKEQDGVQPTGGLASGTPLFFRAQCGLDVPVGLWPWVSPALQVAGVPWGASSGSMPACPHSGCLPGGSLLVLSRTGLQLVLSFSRVAFVCTFPFLSPWSRLLCLLPLAPWFSKHGPWTSASDMPSLEFYLRYTASASLRRRSRNLCFNKLSRWKPLSQQVCVLRCPASCFGTHG